MQLIIFINCIIHFTGEKEKKMRLNEGQKGSVLQVLHMELPVQTERRLEVLGMLEGSRIQVVNRKKYGAMIVKIRGTRFALGDKITGSIEVKEV